MSTKPEFFCHERKIPTCPTQCTDCKEWENLIDEKYNPKTMERDTEQTPQENWENCIHQSDAAVKCSYPNCMCERPTQENSAGKEETVNAILEKTGSSVFLFKGKRYIPYDEHLHLLDRLVSESEKLSAAEKKIEELEKELAKAKELSFDWFQQKERIRSLEQQLSKEANLSEKREAYINSFLDEGKEAARYHFDNVIMTLQNTKCGPPPDNFEAEGEPSPENKEI